MGKHLAFYKACIRDGEMPKAGLCACSWNGFIDEGLLELFQPLHVSKFSYWASQSKGNQYHKFKFTPLRQTIVLFMAAMNNEL